MELGSYQEWFWFVTLQVFKEKLCTDYRVIYFNEICVFALYGVVDYLTQE